MDLKHTETLSHIHSGYFRSEQPGAEQAQKLSLLVLFCSTETALNSSKTFNQGAHPGNTGLL